MITSLEYYNLILGDKPNVDTIKVGPLRFSLPQLKIGITAALIVVPASLLIIVLFKKAGPRKNKKTEKYAADNEDVASTSDVTLDSKDNIVIIYSDFLSFQIFNQVILQSLGVSFSPFLANVPILNPPKIPENLSFFRVFRRYKMEFYH